jgi:nitrogen fixation NifU-like protein
MYSELVMDHFSNPRNVGEIPDADGVGTEGNPTCGDIMKIFIKVEDDKITDIKFKTFGCGAAIATSSMVTEMVKGKSLEEAMAISNKMVAEALGGLPANKMHCSNLAADALHKAIVDYKEKQKAKAVTEAPVAAVHPHEGHACICPFCEKSMEEPYPYCSSCGAEIKYCPKCEGAVAHGAKTCSSCGAALED